MALSFLMLFVELALIRWTGSNVVYLSYFSNFVLLGAFLGIGVGFLRADARRDLFEWAPVVLAGLVVFVLVFPVEIDRSGGELVYFGRLEASGLPLWVMLPVVFVTSAVVMALVAEGVARTFVRFEPLEAYRLDIVGSIAGIAGFSLLAFLRAPPVVWGGVSVALFAVLLRGRLRPLHVVAFVAIVAGLGIETLAPHTTWSPYYKVTAESLGSGVRERIGVYANGIPHQSIQTIEQRRRLEPIYFRPYERHAASGPSEVLVIGAGNGTDVAIALSQDARHVDAVEIDPRLYELGRDLHPERPYQDDRVEVHIADGRAFLENTRRTYDLVLFALPDSLTLVSGQSSLRLESYLFTREAVERAREHLAPGGVFAMYNYYREDWLIDRLAGTLADVYGHPPCLDSVGGSGRLALLTASDDPRALDCPSRWEALTADPPAPVTDDYPFLYLRDRTVPPLYLVTLALILGVSAVAVRAVSGPFRGLGRYLDLFFMGAAFLLLETMHVVRFALLFGTTWFVNALVFAGILLSVLAAIEVARHVRFRRPALLYVALAAALAVAYAVPEAWLLRLPGTTRFAVATVLAFFPIFLANLVFAQRFKHVAASGVAFGANLLGAMLGGVLEYSSLVIGHRTLLVLVAVLYGLAFVFGRDHLAATTGHDPEPVASRTG